MAKKPAHRPHKLTPEVHARIINALTAGNYREVTAAYAGIAASTLYAWLERGEADLARRAELEDALASATGRKRTTLTAELAETETPFAELSEAATRAEAEAEVQAVAALRIGFMGRSGRRRVLEDGTIVETEAVEPDWRAAGEYLRRRHGARWSTTDKLEVQGDHTVHGAVPIEIVPEDERRAEIARLLAGAEGGA